MNRVCPICDLRTDKEICPNDGYATIDLTRFTSALSTDALIGRLLAGKYRLLMKLGKGGMGAVYKATNIVLKQDVAVKILKKELSEDINAVKRFHREAFATSKLKHPNSVRIFDFGQENDGLLFIVMELLEGRPLSEAIKAEKRLEPARTIKIMKQILASLAEAHSSGIIHRDLKPHNIFLLDLIGAQDFVKVLDFGIAKVVSGDTDESVLTKTGLVMGTPHYMSPEQVESKRIDDRSDLYALGSIAYECLAGSPPFTGDTPLSIMLKQKNDAPPRFEPEVSMRIPAGLENLVFRLLEKEPDHRPQKAEAALKVIEDLENHKQPQEIAPSTGVPSEAAKQSFSRDSSEFDTRAMKKSLSKGNRLYFLLPAVIAVLAIFAYFLFRSAPSPEKEKDAFDAQIKEIAVPAKIETTKEIFDAAGKEPAEVRVVDIPVEEIEKETVKKETQIPKKEVEKPAKIKPPAIKQQKKEETKQPKKDEVDLW